MATRHPPHGNPPHGGDPPGGDGRPRKRREDQRHQQQIPGFTTGGAEVKAEGKAGRQGGTGHASGSSGGGQDRRIQGTQPLPGQASGHVQVPLPGQPSHLERPDVIPPNAAPFKPELAGQVPPYGLKAEKATGVIDLGDGQGILQDSGKGPGTENPVHMGGVLNAHVEAHTLARMREAGVQEATVYLNRAPCEFTSGKSSRPDGCSVMLEPAMRPGEKITVYFSPGLVRVFQGR